MKDLNQYLSNYLSDFLLEARGNKIATKAEIMQYLKSINANDILDYLYDQSSASNPPSQVKFIFKTRKDQQNWLGIVESGISHTEFISLINKYGFTVESSPDVKTYCIANDDIRIKCHESGWSPVKGNTDYLTDLKETATVMAIEYHCIDQSDADKLNQRFNDWFTKTYPKMADDESVIKLIPSYITSAIKGAAKFYETFNINPSDYYYERREDRAKKIYKKASTLGAGKADNWNPADMWLIAKNFDLDGFLKSFDNNLDLPMFNAAIKQQMDELNLIPISLKLIVDGDARCDLMNPVTVEDMMTNYDVQINRVTFGITNGSNGTVGSLHVFLNNDHVINVWDKSNGFTATFELRKVGGKHGEGGVDKDYVISHYIYNDQNVGKEIKQLLSKENRRVMDNYIDDIFKMAKQRKISIEGEKGKEVTADELKSMYSFDVDQKIRGRFVMTILNLYYIIKNADKEAVNMMYLAGLKRAPHQCAYWKIH